MKINIKLPAIVLGLMLLLSGFTVKAQDDNVSLQQFYDELSPYGTWIQDPQYGYVWRPDVDQAEFRPYYTNGRWVMTEYGNTWVSNYDWGWAPFHYGRWMYDSYNRWIWIPDTVWGPAWVDWRTGGGYYGWAPMGPVISININIGRRYVRPDYCWTFIPQAHIYYTNFPRYRSYNNITIINRTTIINNTYVYNRRTYYTGPRPEEIRRATNQDVRVYQLARNNRVDAPRIDRNTVNIYSPRPSRDYDQARQAPRNLGTYANNGRSDNRDNNMRNNDQRLGTRGADNGQDRRVTNPTGRIENRGGDRDQQNGRVENRGGRNDQRDQGQQRDQQMRQQQQRDQQMQQQRDQQQRDQQQRDQQMQQQRQQREQQVQQQREQQQRDQQQRDQQMQQQRQQREQQAQQQRDQQQRDQQQRQQQQQRDQQQRQQRDQQMQQQRQQQQQQREQRQNSGGGRGENGGGGRPGRGGR